jgi:hypothetical protein
LARRIDPPLRTGLVYQLELPGAAHQKREV